LATLCRFLIDLQIDLALERSGGSLASWKRTAGELHAERVDIVDALVSRSPERAMELTRAYQQRALTLIESSGKSKARREPDCRSLTAAARLGIGERTARYETVTAGLKRGVCGSHWSAPW